MNRLKGFIVLTMFVLTLLGMRLYATEDDLYQESFPVTFPWQEENLASVNATMDESVFTIATVSNTESTGHGEVQFKVLWNGTTDRYQLLIWSHYSYIPGYIGYRQWFQPPSDNYFTAWPKSGGALPVGWPPTIIGMNKSIQLIDVDEDGDLDVFQLVETETSSEVWTVYLYKNSN
ncbi:MAG: hypothetical protein JSV88_19465 [Candidatus Aminicenantes bacterium]|nr:MAG: hypothetical protein JSV88_19465 [Candidatus Aminicenantes bacterium]